MENVLNKAIQSVQQSEISLSKFITANDAGATGAHQAGYHIPKYSWSLFFDQPGEKGSNKDKFITIKWQDDFETISRFIYYGTGTRNEYRLTRFGKGFPFLQDENIGDLLIISKRSDSYYDAFILNTEEEIEEFFAAFNISPGNANGIITKQFAVTAEEKLLQCFEKFLKSLKADFPATYDLATNARNCYINSHGITPDLVRTFPDREILNWLEAEYQLFKVIERDRYAEKIKTPFENIEQLIDTANTILNRRKSRAGKSLEHHLAEVFQTFQLSFETQAITEGNKKPDFLFPGIEAYQNRRFDEKKLIMLASKTTCKDRWRQILNEADRIKTKHLFTLQQGISKNQLSEMYKYGVCLVVPRSYLNTFPQEYRSSILSLNDFIKLVITASN